MNLGAGILWEGGSHGKPTSGHHQRHLHLKKISVTLYGHRAIIVAMLNNCKIGNANAAFWSSLQKIQVRHAASQMGTGAELLGRQLLVFCFVSGRPKWIT